MQKMPCCWALALVLAGLCGPTAAQPRPSTEPPRLADPSDPAAQARPLVYRPALQNYLMLQEQQSLRDWRAANQRVHEAGGWRSYLREAQAGAASSAQPNAKNPPAASPAHQH